MTEKLYDIDSHLKEFEATVLSCKEKDGKYFVVLDRTAFFPEGGGQKSDRGYIGNSKVLDVQIIKNEIYHITENPIEVDSMVLCTLDWERRFDFMQQHSGEHIVSGVAHSLYGCENVGFHLSEDIVTLDFDKPLKVGEIKQIEQLANKAVFNNTEIVAFYPDENTLKNITYRSKKELEGDIRIVNIKGVDIYACCAPHVKFTGEIGTIKLLSSEALRGGVRIEMKCGSRAIADYSQKCENIRRISSLLCVKQEETAYAVEKGIESTNVLRYEITALRRKLTEEKIKNFNPESQKTFLFEDGLEIKELQHFADALYSAFGGIRGVFSLVSDGFSFAICGEENELQNFFTEFKARFTVKGGGRNGMVQGTVYARKEELENF